MVTAGLCSGYLLLLFLLFSFVLSEVVIMGHGLMARTTDLILSGGQVCFPELMALLLGLTAAGTAASYLKSISGKRYSARVQRDVRLSLGSHLFKLPVACFDRQGTGGIVTRLISDMGEMGRFFSEILPGLLVNLITVITATAYLIHMDPILIFVLFGSYPVMLTVADRLSKKLARLTKKLRTHMDERAKIAYDAIQGMTVGRSYNLYTLHKKKMDTAIDNMTAQAHRSTRISSLGWVLKNLLTTLPVIFCYLFALYETNQGRIPPGEMLAFTTILNRILHPIGDIVFCINDIRQTNVSLKRIQELYNQPKEREGGRICRGPKESVPAIVWQNVDFSYDMDRGRQILNKVSFSIETGTHTAFVGGSGEGKTTIFRLLCGFYERDGGQYLLFGHDFEQWNLEAARSCFSEVSQNVFLFSGTIRENVACGKENASDEEIVAACKNANIHDFITHLPQGYDTHVGERGVRLSGGQRQRISIARAFLKDAPILLLDEPTASVDLGTEQKIQEAIDRIMAGRTVITIAHRLSTIRNAGTIHVISSGTVAESGTHEELLKRGGFYAQMYAKEQEAEHA